MMEEKVGGEFKEFEWGYEGVGSEVFEEEEGGVGKVRERWRKYVLKVEGWMEKKK